LLFYAQVIFGEKIEVCFIDKDDSFFLGWPLQLETNIKKRLKFFFVLKLKHEGFKA
jgi:hypothetical protein